MSFADIDKARNPQAGDWWHDHFCPDLLVLDVTEEAVTFTHEKEAGRYPSEWRWPDNPKVSRTVSRQEFVKLLCYDGDIGAGLWARCVRE